MARFEGTAGPSIFAVGKTVRKDPEKKVGMTLVIGGLLAGGAPATAASHVVSWYTAYSALMPLRPAFWTKVKGDYRGKEYEMYYGLGYEEHMKAKHHPSTAWFMARHRRLWGRPSPWEAISIPTFGFGWGSREVLQSRGGEHTTSSGTPDTTKSIVGPSAKPETPIGGTSTITPRGPHRGYGGKTAGGSRKARGRRTPYCWVHKKRHFCKFVK